MVLTNGEPSKIQPNRLRWHQPAPYGIAEARQSMSGGAAALLGGFSIALTGVIAQAPDAIRWPGWSLLLLTLASVSLVACVQCGFWARSYMYSYQEIADWRSNDPTVWTDYEAKKLRSKQEEDAREGSDWEDRAEWTYHLGLLLLAIGLGLVLAPADDSNEPWVRWIAAIIAFAAGIAQVLWSLHTWRKNTKAT
ncbi:hypothetical protein ACIBAH_29260 [Streptomyces sp. NPDC051445]|uniref:hypothetical protein n=1 Tax=Streptomyces sp. NPDC051445 TaxID=3365653 RepID=UPI0037A46359